MNELISYIESFTPLSTESKSMVLNLVKHKIYQKGEYLLKENTICRKLWFIKNGTAKSHKLSKNNLEEVVGFHFENSTMTQYQSYYNNIPSVITIEAIEDMSCYVINKENEEKLLKRNDYLQFKFLLNTQLLTNLFEDFTMVSRIDAQIRYNYLMRNYPEILKKVKLKDIASFLGITNERLSRIRKNYLTSGQ